MKVKIFTATLIISSIYATAAEPSVEEIIDNGMLNLIKTDQQLNVPCSQIIPSIETEKAKDASIKLGNIEPFKSTITWVFGLAAAYEIRDYKYLNFLSSRNTVVKKLITLIIKLCRLQF